MDEDKPSLEELAHFGVLGMKWGHRNASSASSAAVRAARAHIDKQKKQIGKQESRTFKHPQGSKERKKEEQQLSKMKMDFLKNPDRAVAARTTRGEKVALGLLALSGFGVLPAVGTIGYTSARSRRIEQKQDKGKYNKK